MGNTRSHEKKSKEDDANADRDKKQFWLGTMYKDKFEDMKKTQTGAVICAKISFVVLITITMIVALAVVVVAASTAFATKIYSTELSGRLVAMIILAVTAAITLCICVYAITGLCTKKLKHLHASALLLITLAIIQAIILGTSVTVSAADETVIARSLVESFKLAREDNPRQAKIWATTQSDLHCCGVYGPEDYRTPRNLVLFPPNVPISCCPTYDSDRSGLVQEKEREICKARKEYFDIGCQGYVIEVFREAATMVLGVAVPMILLEIGLVIFSFVLSREKPQPPPPDNDGPLPVSASASAAACATCSTCSGNVEEGVPHNHTSSK